nr:hypothetical protein [Nitrosomonas nitrosa]
MQAALALLSLVTSLVSSGLAVLSVAPILRSLPLKSAYFPATPIQNLNYGELLAFVAVVLTLAFSIGLIHGLAFGRSCSRFVFVAALTPVIPTCLGFGAVTMGMGLLIGLPIVVAYGIAVRRGARSGAQIREQCSEGSGHAV